MYICMCVYVSVLFLLERNIYIKKEKQKKTYALVPSPNGYNDQSSADQKPGIRNHLWVSHVGAGIQGLGPFPAGLVMSAFYSISPPNVVKSSWVVPLLKNRY